MADVEVGRVVVREVAVVVGARVVVVGRVVVLVRVAVVVGFLSAADPTTLVRRSAVEDVVFVAGARLDGVPARDMRLAAPEMPLFSSPELATLEDFSSAELLMDARDRWVVLVLELKGLRAAVPVVVVVGRVGGLFKVLVVLVRTPGFVADVAVEPAGRFAEVALEGARFTVLVVPAGFLVGDAFSLPVSGLVMASDLDSSPDSRAESTGVAGGGLPSASEASATGSAAVSAGASATASATGSGAMGSVVSGAAGAASSTVSMVVAGR